MKESKCISFGPAREKNIHILNLSFAKSQKQSEYYDKINFFWIEDTTNAALFLIFSLKEKNLITILHQN